MYNDFKSSFKLNANNFYGELGKNLSDAESQSVFQRNQNEIISFFQSLFVLINPTESLINIKLGKPSEGIVMNFFVKTFTPFNGRLKESSPAGGEKLFHYINWEITKEKDIEEKLIKFCYHLEEKLPFMIPSNTTFASQIKIFKQLFKPKAIPTEGKKDAWIGVYEVPSKNQIIFLFWFSENQYEFVWPILKDIFISIFLS